MREPFALERLARKHELGRAHAELCIFAAARRPLARALRRKPHADADHRLHSDLARDAQNFVQLLDFLHHEHDLLAELAPEQRRLDEKRILVSVADDQRFLVAVNRERRDQLRLAPGLEADVVQRARVHDLLHHFAELVHLDRKNAAITPAISRLLDRRRECLADRLDAMPQQILKTQHHRKAQPVLAPRLVDDFHDVDRRRRIARRRHLDIAARIDRKIAESPAVDIVERSGGGNIPRLLHGAHVAPARRECNQGI